VAKWLQGHLPGAITMLLLDIESTAKIVDPSQKSATIANQTTILPLCQPGKSSDLEFAAQPPNSTLPTKPTGA
jgi:hypothetical protein